MTDIAAAQQAATSDVRSVGAAKSNPILGVQYLRGFACLAVVLFHVYGGSEGDFYVGQAGVDVFFLISGFIMWTVTSRREHAPGQFLIRRLQRVVPLYWAITLLVFARRYMLGKATLPDLFYSLSFIPHRMADGTLDPIIVPGWTLNFEMFFYVVFALCLVISVTRRLSVATLLLLPLVTIGLLVDFQFPAGTVYTSPLLLEFLAGAWIGYLNSRMQLVQPAIGMAILLLSAGVLVFEQIVGVHLIEWRVLLFGLPSAGILFGTLSLERLTPNYGLLRGLGDASYAIYLVHVPIMSLLLKVEMSLTVRLLVVVSLSIAIGAAFHLLDQNLNKRLRARSASSRPIISST